jgi:hypothetical protein
MTIVNDNSRVINKLEASLTDDARVVIYNHHMFIVQATVVEQVHPSDDTKACNVTIRDSQGLYMRPIVNLIPLKQNYYAECTLIIML